MAVGGVRVRRRDRRRGLEGVVLEHGAALHAALVLAEATRVSAAELDPDAVVRVVAVVIVVVADGELREIAPEGLLFHVAVRAVDARHGRARPPVSVAVRPREGEVLG